MSRIAGFKRVSLFLNAARQAHTRCGGGRLLRCSGRYFHQHYAAWNAVVYGRKRWFLVPPQAYFGPKQVDAMTSVEWAATHRNEVRPLECVQTAGTVLFVPEAWWHATINLADTVGIAVEVGPSSAA